MLLDVCQNKEKIDLSYNMKVIRYYRVFQLYCCRRILIFLTVSIITDILYAQEIWTKDDSVKLSQILSNETPIYIDSALKRELEHLFIGNPIKDNGNFWNDFISLDIKSNDSFAKRCKIISYNIIDYKPQRGKLFNTKNEYLKVNKFTINGHVNVDNSYISIQRNANLSFFFHNKLHFDISGGYILDKLHSAVLPVNPIPYIATVGFSYKIKKNMAIQSQANYQYNIIQKKWEWFWNFKYVIIF